VLNAALPEGGSNAAAREICLQLLTTRLRFFEDRKRFPIAGEAIAAPLFATGEPRCGTTLLHALLSVDPNGRSPRFWEVADPSPPPGLAAPDDPRRAVADAYWRDANERMPLWLASHPYNDMLGEGLPECERTWAFDFQHLGPTVWWRAAIPMQMTGLPTDHQAQYRLHRMMLQACQYGRPEKYWTLKGFHGGKMGALFETYPDARVIWIHRDPVQCIASRIAMVIALDEGATGQPLDRKAAAAFWLGVSRASIAAGLNTRWLDDPRVHHVRYGDFIADPVGTIREFYQMAGKPFTPAFERAIRHYLANNRGDRHGKFAYSLDLIGKLIAEFAPYRERFGLEIEKRR
jgi:hypothetical protein